MWRELLKDFYQDLKTQRTRSFLTIVAITWGTIAVVLLLSFGNGLGTQMELGLLNAGNQIMIVYGGQTGLQFEGMPKGREIELVEEDAALLKTAIPGIDMVSPQYRKTVQLTNGKSTGNTECEGVSTSFEEMRRMYPTQGGRFLNDVDVARQRRSIVLGSEITRTIFGEGEHVGKTVMVDNVPFTLVGVLQKKIQTSTNNGPDDERAVIPYTTFRTLYGNRYVNSVVVRPADPADQKRIKAEIYRVLGRKYRFDPEDERALGMWDFIENARINHQISVGVSIFLFSVGFLTLLIAGVGVANVMYAIVKERTREIGIRIAVGARRSHILAQFIFQALFIAFIGGAIGLLFSWGVVSAMKLIPSDEGAMRFLGKPILSPFIMLVTAGILGTIGLLAGLFPARRAAGVDPVESLRYE
jgi:putative ABC transport system permease protein